MHSSSLLQNKMKHTDEHMHTCLSKKTSAYLDLLNKVKDTQPSALSLLLSKTVMSLLLLVHLLIIKTLHTILFFASQGAIML
jgi:hypothetical protein